VNESKSPAAASVPTQAGPASQQAKGEPQVRDIVEVRLPAASAYLSILRTATAGLAARLDFTLDEIEDLRIAVDEACAMLLPQAAAGHDLTCRFQLDHDALDVTVSLQTTAGSLPERDTFSWTVLTALAGEVDAGVEADHKVWIRLHKRRGLPGSA
jgi:serine/threonine-protein kinase RsbW